MTVGFGIAGLGTIGTGVFELWRDNRSLIQQRSPSALELVEVADVRAPDHLQLGAVRYSADAFKMIRANDVHVIVELIGGTEVAHEVVHAALSAGKSVVTANKALIAKHGDSLHELAHKNRAWLAYEASVCGGIPLLSSLTDGLIANRIRSITGTVNGTCNYILTRMFNEGMDFASALEQAQKLGFAEADPSFDIDGIDAAHKTVILAGLAFGVPFDMDKCHILGIRDIATADLHHCQRLGFRLMHLSRCQADGRGVQLGAFPGLVPASHILADTFMEMNAVVVDGDGTGPTFYYGAGAGARPTASAVLSDVVDVLARVQRGHHPGTERWYDPERSDQDGSDLDITHTERCWYLRFATPAAQITDIDTRLGQCGIVAEQKLYCSAESGEYLESPEQARGTVDYVVITQNTPHANLNALRQKDQSGQFLAYPIVDLPE